MQKSLSWEADGLSASQDISPILSNPKPITVLKKKIPSLVFIPYQTNPVHTNAHSYLFDPF